MHKFAVLFCCMLRHAKRDARAVHAPGGVLYMMMSVSRLSRVTKCACSPAELEQSLLFALLTYTYLRKEFCTLLCANSPTMMMISLPLRNT